MNILYLNATSSLDETGKAMLTLLQRLDRARFSPYAILSTGGSTGDSRLLTSLREGHIPVGRYPLARPGGETYTSPVDLAAMGGVLLDSTMLLVKLIKKYRMSIVQSNGSSVVSGALAAWVTGVPHIWHLQEIFEPDEARIRVPILDMIPGRVVVVSDHAAKSLVEYRPSIEKKLRTIKNGVDPGPFRSANPEEVEQLRAGWGAIPAEKIVGIVVQPGADNGIESMVQLAGRVSERVQDAKFAVISSETGSVSRYGAEIRERLAAQGITGRVIVPEQSVPAPVLMNAIDLLVELPSRPQGFGMVAAEAMSAGKPAVVAAVGGLSEVVCDFETGYHVAPGDTGAAVERTVELLTGDRLRKHMGKAASRRVDREFSPATYAEQFQDLYQEITDGTYQNPNGAQPAL